MLTSSDLYSIYQTAVASAVQVAEPADILRGALKGAQAAAMDQGLMPIDAALLDTIPVALEAGPQAMWADFGDAYDQFVRKLGHRFDVKAVGQGAARGMIAPLRDPLATVREAPEIEAAGAMDAGIGVILAPQADAGPVVRVVAPEGPAARAGVRPGDVIRAVGSRDTRAMDVYDVLAALSGRDGSQVAVSIIRGGGEAVADLEITRSRLGPRALSGGLIDDVLVVEVHAFETGVANELARALEESASTGTVGWVVDLRGNGEGTLTEAARVASLFVGQQTLGQEQDRDGRGRVIRGPGPPLARLLPLVVLVDGATAGPAELLVAAVQDYGAGTIVGTPSGGRLGTTRLIPLSDGSAAEISVRRIVTPSGKPLLGSGVVPDEQVIAGPQEFADGVDPVLDQALRLLRS